MMAVDVESVLLSGKSACERCQKSHTDFFIPTASVRFLGRKRPKSGWYERVGTLLHIYPSRRRVIYSSNIEHTYYKDVYSFINDNLLISKYIFIIQFLTLYSKNQTTSSSNPTPLYQFVTRRDQV